MARAAMELVAPGMSVIVNDGSAVGHLAPFERVAALPGVTLLHHEHNRGKGAALKTAFRYVVEQDPGPGHRLITLDADGQHRVEDVEALARRAKSKQDELVLGVRAFSGEVPWRSRLGNRLTRRVL